MTRVHQAFCLTIIAFTGWVMYEAFQLTYYTQLGPGPGFFPFWLAVLMCGLSVSWLIQLGLHPVKGEAKDFVPSKAACIRIGALILSNAVFALLLEPLGFSITMFLFLLFLLVALGRQGVVVTLAVSILGSFGLFYVFTHYLTVSLPDCPIEFLRNLGF
jgi:putative tricarboxylic transport membrane protein